MGIEAKGSMGEALDEAAGTALVEVSPGTALVFGEVSTGLDLIPFTLVSADDQVAIGSAVAQASSILNVGGQLAAGLTKAQGLVRLAPQTLKALQAGAVPVESGGYNIGERDALRTALPPTTQAAGELTA